MFNQKNVQRIFLLFQPLLVGYMSSFLSDYISGMSARDSQLFSVVRSRSFLTPPGFVFPIVWGILYVLMGYAVYRIFKSKKKVRDEALFWNQIQLFFNFIWTILYFGLGMPLLAFLDILLLLGSITITALKYREIDMVAFYLMIPYLSWVSFATYLNFLAIF